MKSRWTAGPILAALLALLVTGCVGHRAPAGLLAPTELARILSLAADPDDPNLVYVGTSRGAYELILGQEAPAVRSVTSDDLQVQALEVLPGEPRQLLIGSMLKGVWLARRTGSGWQNRSTTGVGPASVSDLHVEPEPGLVYVASAGGLLAGTTGELVFQRVEGLPPESVPHWVFADPARPELLQVVDFRQTHFVSTDQGRTWEELARHVYLHSLNVRRDGVSVGALVNQEQSITIPAIKVVGTGEIRNWSVDPSDTRVLLVAGFGSGLFRLTRSGSSWSSIRASELSLEVTAVVHHPKEAGLAFAAEAAMVHRTTDGGLTWAPLWEKPSGEPPAKSP